MKQAEQWGADLVIIGRKTFMKWSDILSQKVSRYVLDHADCSVFVIQTGISAMDSLPVAEAQPALN
ncbi:MAG: universal stress protein [Cyanobacteriota bacterium]|nr:universal stress protein [Cyanobacteriota bacterium]